MYNGFIGVATARGILAVDQFNITITPNPSEKELNIKFLETIKIDNICIYDLLDKEI